jgi:myb proto-oncogene protein
MEGRTDNDVKNHWNTKLKKRLLAAALSPSPPPHARLPAPAPASSTAHASSLFPSLDIPTVKTEAYTCDDFLAPALGDPFAAAADGSTSAASAASSASNWSTADNGASEASLFLLDFCAGPDLGAAAADQLQLPLPGGYYYPLDPSL